jgi:hypothetical protein
MKALICSLSCLTEANEASLSELPCRIENGTVMSGWRPLIKGYFAVAR